MTEISTIEGGQKRCLLTRGDLKKGAINKKTVSAHTCCALNNKNYEKIFDFVSLEKKS